LNKPSSDSVLTEVYRKETLFLKGDLDKKIEMLHK
jgi:hypothetical protein